MWMMYLSLLHHIDFEFVFSIIWLCWFYRPNIFQLWSFESEDVGPSVPTVWLLNIEIEEHENENV